jgi:hypothetical protein
MRYPLAILPRKCLKREAFLKELQTCHTQHMAPRATRLHLTLGGRYLRIRAGSKGGVR